jgi:hypothetical protein
VRYGDTRTIDERGIACLCSNCDGVRVVCALVLKQRPKPLVMAWRDHEVEGLGASRSIYVIPGAGAERQSLGSKRHCTVTLNTCESSCSSATNSQYCLVNEGPCDDECGADCSP